MWINVWVFKVLGHDEQKNLDSKFFFGFKSYGKLKNRP